MRQILSKNKRFLKSLIRNVGLNRSIHMDSFFYRQSGIVTWLPMEG